MLVTGQEVNEFNEMSRSGTTDSTVFFGVESSKPGCRYGDDHHTWNKLVASTGADDGGAICKGNVESISRGKESLKKSTDRGQNGTTFPGGVRTYSQLIDAGNREGNIANCRE
jgi:hypothetical protein